MDLIPIIEYTLLIFIGLLLIVILSSYILFLIRKKRDNEVEETVQVREYIHRQPEVQYLIPMNDGSHLRYSGNNTELNENKKKQKTSDRFTILNSNSENQPAYSPERLNAFDHRFASSKSSDAFAMFK